jgi:polysaccharide biosynthesis/export protein
VTRTMLVFVVALAAPLCGAYGQAVTGAAPEPESGALAALHARLATTSRDYPVTPGDEYRLAYRQGDSIVTTTVIVDSDYRIPLGLFGSVDASNMAFADIKQQVERLILNGYPRSSPSLTLSALSEFRVVVRGDVPRAAYYTAWGLTRISDVLNDVASPTSSQRSVRVVSRDGTSRTYDVLSALRSADPAGNPYVKPGDTIVLAPCERRVQLAGAVRMPGTYELVPGEELSDLITSWGGGLSSGAEPGRVGVRSVAGERSEVQYVRVGTGAAETTLQDGDVVTVASKDERRPSVVLEGAISSSSTAPAATTVPVAPDTTTPSAGSVYGRIFQVFLPGETLSDVLVANRRSFSPLADLAAATLIREDGSAPRAIDLRPLLSSSGGADDLVLQANDRIVIPFTSYTVYVGGAVSRPGAYPYSPGSPVAYYVTLAGGTGVNQPDRAFVSDGKGNQRTLAAAIQPGDLILVPRETITVQGAALSPGEFAFSSGMDPSTYIALAGGADPERNANGAYEVYSSEGRKRAAAESLAPGDRIYLPSNNFLYNVNRYAPLLATLVSTVLTIVTIYYDLAR